MNIKQLIKENYEIAKSKGFYPKDSKIEDHLMGIVSELGEAYEAHRGGKFATIEESPFSFDTVIENMEDPDCDAVISKDIFEVHVKDSFEDELADVFIRLFNLCGWLGMELTEEEILYTKDMSSYYPTVNKLLMAVTSDISSGTDFMNIRIRESLRILNAHCIDNNIPIEKHIKAKQEYNKTRDHLHGKQY